MNVIVATLLLSALSYGATSDPNLDNEDNFVQYMKGEFENVTSKLLYDLTLATWDNQMDLNNKEKSKILSEKAQNYEQKMKEMWDTKLKNINKTNFKTEFAQRQLIFLSKFQDFAMDSDDSNNLTAVSSEMINIYTNARICPYTKQNCTLPDEGLTHPAGVNNASNISEIAYDWIAFQNATGPKMRPLFAQYVQLHNKYMPQQGFKNYGEFWRSTYETPNFEQEIDAIWLEIQPFYDELHKFVKHRLRQKFGKALETPDGYLVPYAHDVITLNTELFLPYPNASQIDLTSLLEQQNYTVLQMFQTADNFYQSLGLPSANMSFNESLGAMITKPDDEKAVVCHPTAWSFNYGNDFRIKMCAEVYEDHFYTIHHELGHIQYYMLYAHQPLLFREAANPGFAEAIGDAIALAVQTPKHLKQIGLVQEGYQHTKKSALNALMKVALEKILQLPKFLIVDKWRWDVFSGKVNESNWNAHYWHLMAKFGKWKPAIERSEKDFDVASIFHISYDYQNISYFIAYVLQFQLYKSFCLAAGQYDPNDDAKALHLCDFYQSKEAGAKLANGLKLGRSVHWQRTLEIMTGEKKLNSVALMEYFQPLYKFLKSYNAQQNV